MTGIPFARKNFIYIAVAHIGMYFDRSRRFFMGLFEQVEGFTKAERRSLPMPEEYLIAFDSTQQAIRAEMLLEYSGIEIDTRPTPKEITAGCALSIGFPADEVMRVKQVIETEHVEIKGIYLKKDAGYVTIEV